jgi:flagellar biosynthetic protein FliO
MADDNGMDAAESTHSSPRMASRPARLGVAAICVFVAPFLASAMADSPDGPQPAAPNTSASVEEPLPAEPPESLSSSDGPTLPARRPDDAGKPPIRPRRAGLRLEPSQDESQPWYRSAFGSLVIVLGIIVAASWLVRRIVPSARASQGGAVTIVARTQISQKQGIALLQIGRRVLVLGVSPGRVDRLAEIDDACEVAEILARTAGKHADTGLKFNSLLKEQSEDFTPADESDGTDRERAALPTPVSALLRRLKTLQRSA